MAEWDKITKTQKSEQSTGEQSADENPAATRPRLPGVGRQLRVAGRRSPLALGHLVQAAGRGQVPGGRSRRTGRRLAGTRGGAEPGARPRVVEEQRTVAAGGRQLGLALGGRRS